MKSTSGKTLAIIAMLALASPAHACNASRQTVALDPFDVLVFDTETEQ